MIGLGIVEPDIERLSGLSMSVYIRFSGSGLSYPKHAVKYEHTIVTPAVNHISGMELFEDDRERSKTEAARLRIFIRIR